MEDEWITALGDEDQINPEPIVLEETELIVNEFLSPSKLEQITGVDDLSSVDTLEMIVNTSEITLGNFGQYLPSLTQLKLSDSVIPSVRDIGTSLSNLSVLWMSRCGLHDVDGIASLQNLRELYVAYNNIEDISPISFIDSLEVLDLEGNRLSNLEQLDYLSIMCSLVTLTLAGNPIAKTYKDQSNVDCSFRRFVLQKISSIKQLDDKSGLDSNDESDEERPGTSASFHSQEDIDIVTAAIKEGVLLDSNSECNPNVNKKFDSMKRPSSANASYKEILPLTFSMTPSPKFSRTRPSTATSHRSPMMAHDSEIFTSPVLQTRPGSSGSEGGMLQQDDSSTLTFGDPMCGNPIHALRNRKMSPIPTLTMIKPEEYNRRAQVRPSTSMGVRQLNLGQSLKTSKPKTNLSLNFDKTEQDISRPFQQFTIKDNATNKERNTTVENTNGIMAPRKSSVQPSPPPKAQMSPVRGSSPIISPSPPRSPQRPQTASDFRAQQFRRSYSERPLNPLSISSGVQRFRHRNLVRMKADD